MHGGRSAHKPALLLCLPPSPAYPFELVYPHASCWHDSGLPWTMPLLSESPSFSPVSDLRVQCSITRQGGSKHTPRYCTQHKPIWHNIEEVAKGQTLASWPDCPSRPSI